MSIGFLNQFKHIGHSNRESRILHTESPSCNHNRASWLKEKKESENCDSSHIYSRFSRHPFSLSCYHQQARLLPLSVNEYMMTAKRFFSLFLSIKSYTVLSISYRTRLHDFFVLNSSSINLQLMNHRISWVTRVAYVYIYACTVYLYIYIYMTTQIIYKRMCVCTTPYLRTSLFLTWWEMYGTSKCYGNKIVDSSMKSWRVAFMDNKSTYCAIRLC